MKARTRYRILFLLLAAALLAAAFSLPVLADLEEETVTEPPESEPTEEAPGEDVPNEETGFSLEDLFPGLLSAFTPEGNLTLVDDFLLPGGEETSGSKQFITVQTKGGNYFYIIIDRAGDSENVYFLNKVDEADLLALTDKPETTPGPSPEPTPKVCTCRDKCYAGHVDLSCPVCAYSMNECTGKEAKPEQTRAPDAPEGREDPAAEKRSSVLQPALLIAALLAAAGGAVFFVLKRKGKDRQKAKGRTVPDRDEDGDEYAFEPYDPDEDAAEDENDGPPA